MTLQKPEPYAKTKARRKRQAATARGVCLEVVWERDRGCCVKCGRAVRRFGESEWYGSIGHVDEIIPKSLGGDPTDPDNCRLLCHDCHFSGPSGAHRVTRRGGASLE